MVNEEISRELAEKEGKVVCFLMKKSALSLTNILKAIKMYLKNRRSTGEQTMKQLVKSGAKLENIPVEDNRDLAWLKAFCKEYHIDMSILQEKGSDKALVFFKGKDLALIMTMMEKVLTQRVKMGEEYRKPSVLQKMAKFRKIAKALSQLGDKVRHKEKEGPSL